MTLVKSDNKSGDDAIREQDIGRELEVIRSQYVKDPRDALTKSLSTFKKAEKIGYNQGAFKAKILAANIYMRKLFMLSEAEVLINELAKEAQELDDMKTLATVTTMLGTLCVIRGMTADGMEHLARAERLISENEDEELRADNWMAYGSVYYHINEFDKALEYDLKSLAVREKSNDKNAIANLHNNIGNIYDRLNIPDKSLDHYQLALAGYIDTGDQQGVARIYTNLSLNYAARSEGEKALDLSLKALKVSENIGLPRQICICLLNVGEAYELINETETGLQHTLRALDLAREHKLVREETAVLNNIGKIYAAMENYEAALKYLDEGLEKSIQINDKYLIRNNHLTRSILNKVLEDYKSAYEEHVEYVKIEKQINAAESLRRIEQLKMQFDVERKEKEAEIYRLQNVELAESNQKLKEALDSVKVLSGLVPICAHCKNIRDDRGFWNQLEQYITEHSDATFSHGICPDCLIKYYPQFAPEVAKNRKN